MYRCIIIAIPLPWTRLRTSCMPSVSLLRPAALQPAILKNAPVPLLYTVTWVAASATKRPTGSLQVAAVSVALICFCLSARALGSRRSALLAFDLTTDPIQQRCCAAGLFLALALLCERAAGNGSGIWWSKVSTSVKSEDERRKV